jgi:CubicO group peptidase (beta-lactamase class C family)
MGFRRFCLRGLPLLSCFCLLLPSLLRAQSSPAAAVSGNRFSAVDHVIEEAIAQKEIPGAVLLVGHDGHTVYRKAYGMRSLAPTREAMTVNTVFDVASLTKPVATAISAMQLVDHGQLRLNDPVARYIPSFAADGKDQITVRELLTHYSGLAAGLPLDQLGQGREAAFHLADQQMPINPPGSRFLYSDVNYIVLGELVERISGQPLDQYTAQHIFQPLGMTRTAFNPPVAWRAQIAPTTWEGGQMLRGVVHDPVARRMGGVGGPAGLLITPPELSLLAGISLERGE